MISHKFVNFSLLIKKKAREMVFSPLTRNPPPSTYDKKLDSFLPANHVRGNEVGHLPTLVKKHTD